MCRGLEIPKDPRITYVYQPTKMKLGEKRNYIVSVGSNMILAVMDDDDGYPPESILRRVTYSLQSGRECV